MSENSDKPIDPQPPYSVGFRRPPKEHQFKKGQPGRSPGRPKGSKNYKTLVRQHLDKRTKLKDQHGKKTSMTTREYLVKRVVNAAKTDAIKYAITVLQIDSQTTPVGDEELLSIFPEDMDALLADFLKTQSKPGEGA